ncbi:MULTISPECIES: AAA family ATPase [Staphylococcus]|uniref:AAA family ATPase n=1 Tax=Staphylococcus TaxID=1279 RepID=UPI000D0230D5|nr:MULTISPECIES: AAA family ATPase [Staphylococcus]MDT0715999.1 AAA family ATPase [Staphylococcus chromogenes]NHM77642.1 AAA family ATPase [Staphylococcus sp. 11511212]PTF58714.1 DNA topology modulation protein FlaR [Staphylococcus chromogenes]PTF78170.1 DNA topology modulation protein FlaR [Staphylococcus chromogenes]PTF93699.1 DNA topology modulation protein FlaR [Staphylococcus chromogenes]
MMSLNRIVIMGSPGTGKSTLAYKIAQQTKLPLYHMDALFWEGTQNVSDDVLLERLDTLLQKEKWIIDGNYKDTLEMRVAKADLVIWMKAPRWKCVLRVMYRYLKGKRLKGPGANPDILEPSFIQHIWRFPEKSFPEMNRIYETYKNQCRWMIIE